MWLRLTFVLADGIISKSRKFPPLEYFLLFLKTSARASSVPRQRLLGLRLHLKIVPTFVRDNYNSNERKVADEWFAVC
jgi:hypothetical protein